MRKKHQTPPTPQKELTPEQEASLEEGRRILAQAKKKRRFTDAEEIVARGRANKRRGRLTNEGRDAMAGYLFILPWIIGFLLFFIGPLIQSFIYSLNEISFAVLTEGGESEMVSNFVGFQNYVSIFTTNLTIFWDHARATLGRLAYNLPIITLLSLFVAMILNQKFRGRTVFRAIFFMPVIIASGAIVVYITSNMSALSQGRGGDAQNEALFAQGMNYIYNILQELSVGSEVILALKTMIGNIFNTVWLAGIQILLFLGALQTIPTSFYEASAIEGASGWVTFWKVTFPIVSPYMLVTVVYTVIDSFSDITSERGLLSYILEQGVARLGYSSALAWVYFIAVAIILGLIMLVLNKFVFYMAD